MKTNESKKFKCPKCKKEFLSKQGLDRHIAGAIDCVTRKKKVITDGDFKCDFCNKFFTRDYILKSHYEFCKKKNVKQTNDIAINNPTENTIKTIVSNLTNSPTNITNSPTNITNNTNNTTNTVNNYIVSKLDTNGGVTKFFRISFFGKNGIASINPTELVLIIFKPSHDPVGGRDHPIGALLRAVNFNRDKPEHHNVYCDSMKDGNCYVFTENGWETRGAIATINQIICEKSNDLQGIYNKISPSLNEQCTKHYNEFMMDLHVGHNDGRGRKRLEKHIKEILVNEKEIPKSTRKRWEALRKHQRDKILHYDINNITDPLNNGIINVEDIDDPPNDDYFMTENDVFDLSDEIYD
jgi:hypothetical protein